MPTVSDELATDATLRDESLETRERSTLVRSTPNETELRHDDLKRIALAKKPSDRFEGATALASALRAAASNDFSSALRDRARKLLTREPWQHVRP